MHDHKATTRRPLPPRRADSSARDSGPLSEAERLLKVREVARMLFVSRVTVYSMIRRGELRAIYIRHMVRLRPVVVTTYARMHQEWVARHRARAERKRRRGAIR